MLNRAFFSLQSPWVPTSVALANLGVNVAADAALYHVGVWGIPLATSIVNVIGAGALAAIFRRRVGPLEGRRVAEALWRIVASAAVATGVAYGLWYALDRALGDSLGAQIVSLGGALVAGAASYLLSARLLGIRELDALLGLWRRSGPRRDGAPA
jgi:putative peptidoglycan lipid II flippase